MNIVSENIDYGSVLAMVVLMLVLGSVLFWIGYSSYRDNKREAYPSAKPMIFLCIVGIVLCFFTIYKYTIYSPVMIIKAEVEDVNEVYDNGYEIIGRDGELFIISKTK